MINTLHFDCSMPTRIPGSTVLYPAARPTFALMLVLVNSWRCQMAVMTNRVTAMNVAPEAARIARESSASARFGRRGRAESSEHSTNDRPRKMRTLLALCISQIGETCGAMSSLEAKRLSRSPHDR